MEDDHAVRLEHPVDVEEVDERGVEEVQAVDQREVDARALVAEAGEGLVGALPRSRVRGRPGRRAQVELADAAPVARLVRVDRDVLALAALVVHAADRERREPVRHAGLERAGEVVVADEALDLARVGSGIASGNDVDE